MDNKPLSLILPYLDTDATKKEIKYWQPAYVLHSFLSPGNLCPGDVVLHHSITDGLCLL